MPQKSKTILKTKAKKTDSSQVTKLDIQEKQVPTKNSMRSYFGILFLIITFFVLGSFFYRNKGLLIAATVDNKPIFSFELYKRLVNQSGKQMLDQLVVERLIKGEGTKQNINIATQDIDKEVKRIEENLGQSVSLADALSTQGMTMTDLQNQIRIRLTASRLVEGKVKVTDEEVDKYLKDNKDFLTKDEDEAKQKEDVKSFLEEQKLNQEIQKLIQELKSQAKISLFL